LAEERFSAATGNNGDANFQGDCGVGKFLLGLAAAPEGGAEGSGERDAGERRGYVRTIVDVLVKQATFAGRAAGFADKVL